jgi:hypothetical protein
VRKGRASQQQNEAGLLHIVDLLSTMNYSYEVIRGMKTHRAHTRAYYLDHASVKSVIDRSPVGKSKEGGR